MSEKIELFYEPKNDLKNTLGNNLICEMTDVENAFLCGLIKQKKPKKIVEVGVAEGGTTTVIMNTLIKLDLKDTELFSVDRLIDYYRDTTKKTGYIAIDNKKSMFPEIKWRLYSGVISPEILEEIGDGIDFLILDTVHSLPGELIDFPAYLPFLENKAVVILHDTLNHIRPNATRAYATNYLYNLLSADKIKVEAYDKERPFGVPNISAFTINEETRGRIIDVFSGMTLTWEYLPKYEELNLYHNWYSKYYDKEIVDLYDFAVCVQERIALNDWHGIHVEELKKKFKRGKTYLFGYGTWGLHFWNVFKRMGYEFEGIIVSDNSLEIENNLTDIPIIKLSELNSDGEVMIVVTTGPSARKDIISKLNSQGFRDVH